jgi:hypothetical protein
VTIPQREEDTGSRLAFELRRRSDDIPLLASVGGFRKIAVSEANSGRV